MCTGINMHDGDVRGSATETKVLCDLQKRLAAVTVTIIYVLLRLSVSLLIHAAEESKMAEFYDWLARNYKNYMDSRERENDKRSTPWQFK